MPDFEVSDLYHKAVVWTDTDSVADSYGQFQRASKSIELSCRWNDKKTVRRDAKGNAIALDAWAAFDRPVALGSTVFKGSLLDLAVLESARKSNALTPTANNTTLYEVTYDGSVSDIRNRAQRYEYGLKRLSDTIPDVIT
jgi:hypothetical protein